MIALAAGFAAGWLLASRSRASNEEQLREAFQALAATTLKTTTDEFLKLADQKIGNVHREATIDLTRRQQELGTLVTPIKDTLQLVDAKLKEVEKTRIDDSASMRSMLGLVGHTQQQLQQETQNLVRALRSPGVRGQWGEVQLRKVVELSGMLENCDFDQQPTIFAESGRLRPDMTINLPGGRTIVVDAKAPLEAFLDAQAATEDGVRSGKLADHVRQVKDHVTKLGAKAYWDALPSSPELVVLFLPAEAIYMAALERDSALIDFSVKQKVLIASPLTLDRAAPRRGVRLEPGAADDQRGRDQPAGPRASRERGHDGRTSRGSAPAHGWHVLDLQQGRRLVRKQRAGEGAPLPRAWRRQRKRDSADRSARNRGPQTRRAHAAGAAGQRRDAWAPTLAGALAKAEASAKAATSGDRS